MKPTKENAQPGVIAIVKMDVLTGRGNPNYGAFPIGAGQRFLNPGERVEVVSAPAVHKSGTARNTLIEVRRIQDNTILFFFLGSFQQNFILEHLMDVSFEDYCQREYEKISSILAAPGYYVEYRCREDGELWGKVNLVYIGHDLKCYLGQQVRHGGLWTPLYWKKAPTRRFMAGKNNRPFEEGVYESRYLFFPDKESLRVCELPFPEECLDIGFNN